MNTDHNNKLNILLLDESPTAANETARLLSTSRKCEIEILYSVRNALQTISRNKPDLIITEWELKDYSATELLRILNSKEDLKNIPVIVCTVVRSNKLMMSAKNLGVSGVLLKPVNEKRLAKYIDNLFPLTKTGDHENIISDAAEIIKEQIKQIDKLSPLPTLAKEIINITNDPNSTARDLADVIRRDQTIVARLLKIVNSAYFNFYRKISDVSRAIVILGLEEVRNISLAACLMSNYPSRNSPHFNRDDYWKHAFGVAYISKELSKLCRDIPPEDAFTMGLLHDFGKVVFDQHFGEIFDVILKIAHRKERPLHLVSKELIKIDHPTLGGLITESWKLPNALILAIRYHHEPYESFTDNQISLVHLANYFCHKYKIGSSGNPVPDEVYPASLPALGLDGKDLDEVWALTKLNPASLSVII
ncbi:response regulator [bacterium]|nr:response regulator [bacterium]